MQQTLATRQKRPSRAEQVLQADVRRFAEYLAELRAACPRTMEVLDTAWARLDRELDGQLRAGLSDLVFTLGVYQDARHEITAEEADQVYLFLVGDLQ